MTNARGTGDATTDPNDVRQAGVGISKEQQMGEQVTESLFSAVANFVRIDCCGDDC